jgi:hypothetical protein
MIQILLLPNILFGVGGTVKEFESIKPWPLLTEAWQKRFTSVDDKPYSHACLKILGKDTYSFWICCLKREQIKFKISKPFINERFYTRARILSPAVSHNLSWKQDIELIWCINFAEKSWLFVHWLVRQYSQQIQSVSKSVIKTESS